MLKAFYDGYPKYIKSHMVHDQMNVTPRELLILCLFPYIIVNESTFSFSEHCFWCALFICNMYSHYFLRLMPFIMKGQGAKVIPNTPGVNICIL